MWNKMKLTRGGVALGIILSILVFPFVSFPTAMQFTEASTRLTNGVSTATSSTWYVNATLGTDDGSHGTGTGTDAFKTIPFAVEKAGPGDTVFVETGTYSSQTSTVATTTVWGPDPWEITGSLVITKPVILIGEGSGKTFYRGGIVVAPPYDDPIGTPASPTLAWEGISGKVEISGFTFLGPELDLSVIVFGTFQTQVDSFTIFSCHDNEFISNLDTWDAGMYVLGASPNQTISISNNTFRNYGCSLQAFDCKGPLSILHNTCEVDDTNSVKNSIGAVFMYDRHGDFLQEGTSCTVSATHEIAYNTITISPSGSVNKGQPAIFILPTNQSTEHTLTRLENVQIHHNNITGGQLTSDDTKWYPGNRGLIEMRSSNLNPEDCAFAGVHGGSIYANVLIGPGTDTSNYGQGINIQGSNSRLSIYNNDISNCVIGIWCRPRAPYQIPGNLYFYGNTIHGNKTGIKIDALSDAPESGAEPTYFRYNEILGNNFGVSNSTFVAFDFTNNWWGTALGPYHSTLNPSGTGNPVSDNVDFLPWSGEPIPGTAYLTSAATTSSWTVSTPSGTVVIAAEGANGTPTNTVGSCELNGQPLNFPPFDTTGQEPVTVYDVNASGFTTGTVTLTFTYEHNSGEDTYKLWYWDGSAWTLVPTQGNTGHEGTPSHTLWGIVPIAALGGTPLVIGAPSGPVSVPSLSIWGFASLALALLGGGVWTLRKKRG